MAGFQELIDLIKNGEIVAAETPNRPLRQLDANIRYLRDLFQDAEIGQANFIRDATVETNAEEGMPVYFNTTRLQFERAVGSVVTDPLTGFLKTAENSNIAGVVATKTSATKADILVAGYAEIDLSASVSGTVSPGIYYLSNATPGTLTPTLPPTGIPVLQVFDEGSTSGKWNVLLKQQFYDFLNNHRHYSYELVARPAGDTAPPGDGNPHTIINPDTAQEGWLPANNAVFNGLAPANANFGYNISQSPLADIWPPVPLQSAQVSALKQNVYANPAEPVLQGTEILTDEHVVIDENGIWWMTDCYNEVPWPTTLNTGTEESVSLGDDPNACPTNPSDRLFLHWTQASFYTDQTAVLSVRGKEGSGIVFYCRNTDTVKDTGHLEADFDLSLLLNKSDETGHIVFKTLEDGKFNRGPIVESLKSGSPEIALESNVTIGSDGKAYGNVTLKANLDITNSEFAVDTVQLNGTEEESYQDTLAIGFPSTRLSNFRGRVLVPGQITFPVGTLMKLRFWVLARATGTIPNNVFTLTYRVISQPSAVLTAQTLPIADSGLSISAGITINEDEYYMIDSDTFAIDAGDEVLFTLQRAAPDSFGGELHILRMRGIPVAGS